METRKIKLNIVSGTAGTGFAQHAALVRECLPHRFDVRTDSREDSDIVHYYTIDPVFFASIIQKGVRHAGKSVCTALITPESATRRNDLPLPLKWCLGKYMMQFYRTVNMLTVNNPLLASELVRGGISADKIRYIPVPVSKELFHELTPHDRLSLRDKYGIGGGDFVVVGAGRLARKCGIADFVESARICSDMTFVWAGDFGLSDGFVPDTKLDDVKRAVDGAPDNVKFIGALPREHMNEIWGIADVCFLPTGEPQFPYAAVSAMCAGIPVLVRDLPFYSDVMFDYYISESTLGGFTEQLSCLKNDPVYYTNAADTAALGSKFYRKDNVVKLWGDLYADL
ncbi:glycosyl transferase [Clostridia bacterium]|nr:glycosyl transferase [Clostridia bacterium]